MNSVDQAVKSFQSLLCEASNNFDVGFESSAASAACLRTLSLGSWFRVETVWGLLKRHFGSHFLGVGKRVAVITNPMMP